MEKHYTEPPSGDEAITLAIRTLLEVVESGSKNVEVAILKHNEPIRYMSEEDVAAAVARIEAEQEQQAAQAQQAADDAVSALNSGLGGVGGRRSGPRM